MNTMKTDILGPDTGQTLMELGLADAGPPKKAGPPLSSIENRLLDEIKATDSNRKAFLFVAPGRREAVIGWWCEFYRDLSPVNLVIKEIDHQLSRWRDNDSEHGSQRPAAAEAEQKLAPLGGISLAGWVRMQRIGRLDNERASFVCLVIAQLRKDLAGLFRFDKGPATDLHDNGWEFQHEGTAK